MRKPLGIIFDFGHTVLRGEFNPVAGNDRLLELSENEYSLPEKYPGRRAAVNRGSSKQAEKSLTDTM